MVSAHLKPLNANIEKPKTVPLAHLVAARAAKIEPSCSLECKYLASSDYRDLLWTTLAEFPGDMRPLSTLSYSSCLTAIAKLRVVILLLGQHLFSVQQHTQHQYPDWTSFKSSFEWIARESLNKIHLQLLWSYFISSRWAQSSEGPVVCSSHYYCSCILKFIW